MIRVDEPLGPVRSPLDRSPPALPAGYVMNMKQAKQNPVMGPNHIIISELIKPDEEDEEKLGILPSREWNKTLISVNSDLESEKKNLSFKEVTHAKTVGTTGFKYFIKSKKRARVKTYSTFRL